MSYDTDMEPIITLFDGVYQRTWNRIERDTFRRKISQISVLSSVMSRAVSNGTTAHIDENVSAVAQQCVPRPLWQWLQPWRSFVDYDSVAFAISQIARHTAGLWSDYVAGRSSRSDQDAQTERQWDSFYRDTIEQQLAVEGTTLRPMDVLNVQEYHKERLTTITDTTDAPYYLLLSVQYDRINSRMGGDTPFIDVTHLQRAVFSVLFWIGSHGRISEVFNTLSSYAGSESTQFLGRYGWDKTGTAFMLHILVSFQEALRHVTLDPETLWAWQEPMVLESVIQHLDDGDRLQYMCEGVHNTFRATIEALQERW